MELAKQVAAWCGEPTGGLIAPYLFSPSHLSSPHSSAEVLSQGTALFDAPLAGKVSTDSSGGSWAQRALGQVSPRRHIDSA